MILTDRHHADLLYSTQRLFDDRLELGPVVVPVGHDWWDEGIWQFGKSLGDDRLAQQYLVPHEGIWEDKGAGVYVTHDTAHPERLIFGITLERARDHDLQFIMPSVQENAAGFHALALQKGVPFLYQVGNVGQHVPWSLDPLVLTSTSLDLTGRRGVRYHQEIDSEPGGAFAWADPEDAYTIRNFVNAFPRLPGWGDFLEAEAQLNEYTFTSHGHEGRDGNINPVGLMGARMAASGWGWHDKPVGDGFGHVIHSWAAVGRPLIGHARYYRGSLAEPLWQHGVTCIDLDVMAFHDALGMIREISADTARHSEMCRAIRGVFDQLVDYEAEAEAVGRLLQTT